MADTGLTEILEKLSNIEKAISKETKTYWNVQECADELGISPETLKSLARRRKIPHYKPTGNALIFEKGEIRQWLKEGKRRTAEDIRREDLSTSLALENYMRGA